MTIDFIYFDLGGVVIVDFSKSNKWNEMMQDLGVKQEDLPKADTFFDMEDPKFYTGEKSIESFTDTLRKELKVNVPEGYSMTKDFVNRFEPNPTLALIIKDLKKNYKIGLLTNTYTNMLDAIKAKGLLPDVEWDVIVDSSKVGFYKPQTEIYTIATELAQTPHNKILFIENTKANIDKAKELGWNTILYDPLDVEASNNAIKHFLR